MNQENPRPLARILLVEDSPTQARQVAIILESAGYQVSIAKTGALGVSMAVATLPDMILLDVVLPDMDGFAVCRRLRQLITKYTPLVMLTEKRTSIEDKLDGLSVGADDYLPKPIDPRELLARITVLLRIKQTLDAMGDRLQQESQAYEIMKRMALTDPLTGLFNRNYMLETIEREFSLATRYHTPFSCLMIDIDFFKEFNTKYGHPIGDWVLQNVAGLINRNLRQPDVIARYGGDEFLGILPMTDVQQAVEVARRLRAQVASKIWESPAGSLQITISLGIAGVPMQDIAQSEQLIACADKALYQAKENGRNQVCVFQPDLKTKVTEQP